MQTKFAKSMNFADIKDAKSSTSKSKSNLSTKLPSIVKADIKYKSEASLFADGTAKKPKMRQKPHNYMGPESPLMLRDSTTKKKRVGVGMKESKSHSDLLSSNKSHTSLR